MLECIVTETKDIEPVVYERRAVKWVTNQMPEGHTIDRLIDATFAVPTRSEAYKYAAYDGLMRLERRAMRAAAR